jgi:hypothetical protein
MYVLLCVRGVGVGVVNEVREERKTSDFRFKTKLGVWTNRCKMIVIN